MAIIRSRKLATIERDGWQLESGEARHAEAPETFWIPSREQRDSLKPGEAAKLLFMIEAENQGQLERGVERMWVIIRGRLGPFYTGVLDSTPVSIEPDPSILTRGTEVIFAPEHVIDVSAPSREYILKEYGAHFFSPEDGAA
jgi:hypothetical protein